MAQDDGLRVQLAALLKGGNAHMDIDEAVADFPENGINTTFPNGTYSAWALLEHIMLSQKDMLNFMRDADYKEMRWPDDYWPAAARKASRKDWEATINQIRHDSGELQSIALDKDTDLNSPVPTDSGKTLLRCMLVIADHNAYHIGEFAIMRQVMGTWGSSHK